MSTKRYWLPNLFTSLTLISGFYSVTLALDGALNAAVHAIMVAMIFDFLDGWVARKTNTVSDFGKEYDSLCDMVAFGIAPALTAYQLLSWDSVFTWLIPACYSCAVAMRLARFNAKESTTTSFEGLPCTVGGPFVVLMCCFLYQDPPTSASCMLLAAIVLVIAGLMNSTIKYRSLKQNNRLIGRRSLLVVFSIILSVSVFVAPLITLAVLLFAYIVSPLLGIKTYFHQWRGKLAQHNHN